MDYVTKIMIDTSKANRNIRDFEKVLKGGDAAVRKMKDDLNALQMQFQRNEMEKATKDADLYQKELKRLNSEFVKLKNVQKEEAQVVRQNNRLKENQTNLTIKEIRALERKAEAIIKIQRRTDQMNATRAKERSNAEKGLATLDKEYRMILKVAQAEEKLNKAVDKGIITRAKADRVLEKYKANLILTEQNLRRTTNQATLFNRALRLQSQIFHATMLLGTIASVVALGVKLEQTAEKMDLLSQKMKFFSKSEVAFDELKSKALEIGMSIGDLGRIMTRFQITTKGAFDTKEMLGWADALTRSARATGTTTQEMNNALLQLSQSFSAGFLMGDEFRSISENLPMYKIALEETAKAQGKFTGSLKEMSSGRLIDIDLMTDAFKTLGDTVAPIPGTVDTIGAAIERTNSAWTIFVSSIVTTDFTKTSLNTLSMALVKISGSEEDFKKLSIQFPTLVKDANELSDAFTLLMVPIEFFANSILFISNVLVKFFSSMSTKFKLFYAFLEKTGAIEKFKELIAELDKVQGAVNEKYQDSDFQHFINGVYGATDSVDDLTESLEYTLKITKDFERQMNEAEFDNLSIESLQNSLDNLIKTHNSVAKRIKSNESVNLRFFGDKKGTELNEGEDKRLIERREGMIRLAAAIGVVSKELEIAKDKNNEAISSFSNFVSSINTDEPTKHLKKFNLTVEKLYDNYEKAIARTSDHREAQRLLNIGLDQATTAYKKAEKAINKVGRTTKKLSDLQKIANKAQLDISSKLDPYVKALNNLEKIHNKINKTTKELFITEEEYQKAKAIYILRTKEYIQSEKERQAVQEKQMSIYERLHPLEAQRIKDIQAIGEALGAQAITRDEATEQIKKKEEAYEANKICETLKKEQNCLEDLRDKFDPVNKAAKDYSLAIEEIGIAAKHTRISQKALNKSLYDAKKAFLQAQVAAGDFGASLTLSMDKLVGDIGENFKTMMVDAFDGTEDAFESFTERLEDLFKNMLVDMAYQALINPIIVSVQQSMMGGGFGGQSQGGIPVGSSGQSIDPSKLMNNSSSIFNNPNVKIMEPSTWSGIWGQQQGAAVGSAAEFQQFGTAGFDQISNTGIANHTVNGGFSPSANAGVGGLLGGYVAGQVGGWEGAAAGGAVAAGTIAASGAIFGAAAGGVAGAATVTGMAGASGALLGLGPVGWAALAVGIIMSSGVLGGNSDVTPDLNLSYQTGRWDPDNAKGYNVVSSGGNDIASAYHGRFGAYSLSTSHDAFGSDDEAAKFSEAISNRFGMLDEMIFQALGEDLSDKVVLVMEKIRTGTIELEEFAEDGVYTLEEMFQRVFSNIFNAIGEVVGEEYNNVFKRFSDEFSVDIGVIAAVAMGDLKDIEIVSFDTMADSMYEFAKAAPDAEQQMLEIAATVKLFSFADANKEFESFLRTVEGLSDGPIKYTAQELLRLGSQLMSVNVTFENLNMTMFETSISGAKAADSLVTLMGGIDAFTAKTTFYYQNFFTESERLEKTMNSSANAIAGFNEKWGTDIKNKEDLRNTMESLGEITDETSEKTKKFIAALFDLAYPMQQQVDAAEALVDARIKEAKAAVEAEKKISDMAASFGLLSAKLRGISSFVQDQMNVDFLSDSVRTLGIRFTGTNSGFASFIDSLDYSDPKVQALSSDILALGNAIFTTTANVGAAHKDIRETQHMFQGDSVEFTLERQRNDILNEIKEFTHVFDNMPNDMKGISDFIKDGKIDWNNKTILATVSLFKDLFNVMDQQAKAEEDLMNARIEFNKAMSDLISQLLGESEQELLKRRMEGFGEDLAILGKELPTTALGFVDFINALDDTDPKVIALKDSLLGYGQSILDTIELQERLNEAIDEFNLSVNELYFSLIGESDLSNTIRQIEEVYAVFSVVGDHTTIATNDLAQYIRTLDASSEANQEAWHEVEKLGNALITLKEIIADLEDSILSLKEDLFGGSDELNDLLQQRADLLGTSVALYELEKERYEDAIEANEKIIDFLNDISLSDKSVLSPLEKINEAARLFQEAVASGNVDDATSYGKTYLDLAKEGYGSTTEYASIYDEVSAAVGGMTDTSLKNVDMAQLDALNEQIQNEEDNIDLQKEQLERLNKSTELLGYIYQLSLATNSTMVDTFIKQGVDPDQFSAEFIGNQLGDSLLQFAIDNRLTTLRLSDIIGISNDTMIDYLKERGFTDEDIIYWNKIMYEQNKEANKLLISGIDALDSSTVFDFIGQNMLSSSEVASMLNVSNEDVIAKLLSLGITQEQINDWDALTYKESVKQNETLKLVQEDLASISQTETYKAAAEDGYGGNYTDNQILQFSGEYIYKNYEQLLLIASNTQRTANNLKSLNEGLGIIPSYESGTGYVPQDQLAYLHQGEMVINSDMSNNVRKGSGGSNSELINEVRELNEEMRNLRVEVQSLKVINSYGFKESIKQGKRQANAQEEAIEIKRMSE